MTTLERIRRDNLHVLLKLLVVVSVMFGFGYALVPLYKHICEVLGVNVLSLADVRSGIAGVGERPANTQIDLTRTITVEFDANARGVWEFKPAVHSLQIHPGELATVMYEFRNSQNRTMVAQAIPSYAPAQASAHFNKLECFCFTQHKLKPGESKQWPVVFYVDSKLPRDVKTITLSYTFFEVGGAMPAAPSGDSAAVPAKDGST